MKNKIILLLFTSSLIGVALAQNQPETKIYIEAWNRISIETCGSGWFTKQEAEEFLKRDSTKQIEVILGKNLSINNSGFESEIDEIQQWLVSLGFKDITFRLATSDNLPPVVRRYRIP